MLDDPPLETPRRGPGARRLALALRCCGLPLRWGKKLACTEAGVYGQWGVPAYVWGPGVSTGNVHRPNESIALRDLEKAADFYEALFRSWCLTS